MSPRSLVFLSLLALGCSRDLDTPTPKVIPKPGAIDLVLSAAGKPLAGALARIVSSGQASTAGADGKVHFGGLPEGSYRVEARAADGSAAVIVDRVAVFAGLTTDLGQVALPATGSVHGKATLGSSAAGNAGIVVFLPSGTGVALTADDGSYRLDGLAPGSYRVSAALSGWELQLSSEVIVASGVDRAVPDLVLREAHGQRLGAIKGTARRVTAGGVVLSGIEVTLAGAGRSTLTAADGSYALTALPEGRYTAVVHGGVQPPCTRRARARRPRRWLFLRLLV